MQLRLGVTASIGLEHLETSISPCTQTSGALAYPCLIPLAWLTERPPANLTQRFLRLAASSVMGSVSEPWGLMEPWFYFHSLLHSTNWSLVTASPKPLLSTACVYLGA